MAVLHILDHPLIHHKLALLRDKNTSVKDFRELVAELAVLLCCEAARDLPLETINIETPVATASVRKIAGKEPAVVAVLRAGLGMVDGVLRLIPAARVGHIGLSRDPETLKPVQYYCNLPTDIAARPVFLVDPMLATGGSASAAITALKQYGCSCPKLLCLIAAPEGIAHVHAEHPNVPIFVAAVDEKLNSHGYIVPGLGDAGDRIFGTL
ncbi:uracil phosphoribosyltransferase [Oscillospiraceae bacterium CM]|nr:uracil phosphoribosyltransferase [Oscillospiraceae bacterium CM]